MFAFPIGSGTLKGTTPLGTLKPYFLPTHDGKFSTGHCLIMVARRAESLIVALIFDTKACHARVVASVIFEPSPHEIAEMVGESMKPKPDGTGGSVRHDSCVSFDRAFS